jgi:hypothetical protein
MFLDVCLKRLSRFLSAMMACGRSALALMQPDLLRAEAMRKP